MADLADNTAAVAAGYARVTVDRGSGAVPRYLTRYEKPMVNDDLGGYLEKAEGESNVSQVAASAQALTVLNGQRAFRHGSGNKSPRSGAARASIDN